MFLEQGSEEWFKLVDGLTEILNDKDVVIAINDQAGEQIAFGIDATTQHRINAETIPIPVGGLDSILDKLFVDGHACRAAPSQESQRNLRF